MGRNKVKHELITNESVRKVTYRKRKTSLLKKLKELTVLCGVAACSLIYNTHNSSSQPEVWPSQIEATNVLDKFKKLPAKKQGKHMLDQEAFLENSISRANDQLAKQKKKNMDLVLAGCNSDTVFDFDVFCEFDNMNDVSELLERCIQYVDDKINNSDQDFDMNSDENFESDGEYSESDNMSE